MFGSRSSISEYKHCSWRRNSKAQWVRQWMWAHQCSVSDMCPHTLGAKQAGVTRAGRLRAAEPAGHREQREPAAEGDLRDGCALPHRRYPSGFHRRPGLARVLHRGRPGCQARHRRVRHPAEPGAAGEGRTCLIRHQRVRHPAEPGAAANRRARPPASAGEMAQRSGAPPAGLRASCWVPAKLAAARARL